MPMLLRDHIHSRLQTGLERLLRTHGAVDQHYRSTRTFRPVGDVQKRKKLGRPQGNVWDRCIDSAMSTSTEESGKGESKGKASGGQQEDPLGLHMEKEAQRRR